MQTIKYKTKIQGEQISLPEEVTENINPDDEVEVIIRPLKSSASSDSDIEQVLKAIEKRMEERYPNISSPINPKIKAIVGTSSEIKDQYSRYSDKEILTMAIMEKHLEKGEIIESLF